MKYPAILKNTIGGQTVLAVSGKLFIHMSGEFEVEDSESYSFDSRYKNITAEYLANTYGEVKSKEHAEFIVKLAEVNGIVVFKDSETTRPKDIKYFSVTCDGILYFWSDKATIRLDRKQITIPLPPECESVDDDKRPLKVLSGGRVYTFNEVTEHYDYNIAELGYTEGKTLDTLKEADDYEVISFVGDDEWPKINDTVSLRYRFDSKQVMYTGELLYLSSNHIIIKAENGNDCHCIRSEWDIEKPKTPEQELRDELYLLLINHCYSNHQASSAVDDILSKYNITKSRNSG